MAFLGRHVKLTKMQKLLGSKNKNQNEYEKQNETKTKIHFSFQFCFCFHFAFHFRFCFRFFFFFIFVCVFSFHFRLYFSFCFHFRFGFCSCFRLCFSFIFQFLFLNFTMALLGHQLQYYEVLRTPILNSNCERLLLKISISVTNSEVVVQRCSAKKLFLEISQNSKENACARVSF